MFGNKLEDQMAKFVPKNLIFLPPSFDKMTEYLSYKTLKWDNEKANLQ